MSTEDRSKSAVAPAAESGPAPRPRREITSAELLGAAREIHIRHADETYTLRQTSKGKLILTK